MSSQNIQTKEKIFKIAIDLIKEKGFEAVTMNEISEKADVAKNTFYYYFESKEDLLTSYFKIDRGLSQKTINEIVLLEGDFLEILWKVIEPSVDFFIDMGPEILKQIMIINLSRETGTFRNPEEKAHKTMTDMEISLIKKAQKNNQINNRSDAVALTRAIYVNIMGIAFRWSADNGSFDLQEAVRHSIETILDINSDTKIEK